MNHSPIPNFAAGVPCSSSGDLLLPAIAQDADTGRVLMMAWMSEAAFEETVQTRRAVYFSRSRGKLWRKGETSGHQQTVRKIEIDCDADCILLHVEQIGAACHEGFQSCFFRDATNPKDIRVNEPRLVDPEAVYGKQ